MKTASFLIIAAVLAPLAIVFGLSATAAFSLATAAGLGAIAISDYSTVGRTVRPLALRHAERLPLAA